MTTTLSPTQKMGYEAETKAYQFLLDKNWKLVTHNYRCSHGEIDLIMLDQETYVFVEVRLRHNEDYASALESIDRRKQQKIIKTAQHFLQQHQLTDKALCRFDVIAYDANDQRIEWIANAFGVS